MDTAGIRDCDGRWAIGDRGSRFVSNIKTCRVSADRIVTGQMRSMIMSATVDSIPL